jgi:hypothetical protein
LGWEREGQNRGILCKKKAYYNVVNFSVEKLTESIQRTPLKTYDITPNPPKKEKEKIYLSTRHLIIRWPKEYWVIELNPKARE